MEGLNIIEGENITKNEPVLKYQNSEQPISVSDYGAISKDAEKIEKIRRKIDAVENKPKKSSISRIVGKIPEEKKQELLKKYEDLFADQQKEITERKKTPEEVEILALVNKATNEILQKYGLPVFDIPPENSHVIKKIFRSDMPKGHFTPNFQSTSLDSGSSRTRFLMHSFHEVLHFKSYGASQALKDNIKKLDTYRIGLMIVERDGKKTLFEILNEAVTEAMVKKYATQLLSHPLFEREQNDTREEKEKYNDGVFDEEAYRIYVKSKRVIRNFIRNLFKKPEQIEYTYEKFVYPDPRKALNMLINKLFIKNPGKFKDENEIMEMFEKAMLTGNILPIGRLIDKTFPKKSTEETGTFRKIGEAGKDMKRLKDFIDSL
jgi:hypothetical protein